MLAPPWIAIPAPGYGGIEAVVESLCEQLTKRGHDVTLFAAPGSRSPATVRSPLDAPHPEAIGCSLYEADHVASAFADIETAAEEGCPFDVVHDHCGAVAVAMADRLATPMVHTIHDDITPARAAFYARHGRKVELVALSASQRESAPVEVAIDAVVGNPIDLDRWPSVDVPREHLLWIGRVCDDKGPQRAIEAARRARRPLVLAGPIQRGQEAFFAEEVEPQLDPPHVTYVGEVCGEPKRRLFAGAAALLMPIRWREPFGMVMVEALACGTPVVAFAEGAAREIVLDGVNGFLVDDEGEMAQAIGRLDRIRPRACRDSVAERYAAPAIARAYERIYRRVASWRAPELGLSQPSPAAAAAVSA